MTRFSALALALALAGCDGTQDTTSLRAALDASEVSLRETVAVAETATPASRGITARLHPGTTAEFAVGCAGEATLHDVRIDLAGHIVSARPAGTYANDCAGSISLSQAIAIAEAEVSGSATAIEPDDDGPCNREVQVLVGDTLWEVKVGPTGQVIETELSDETED
ncbi:MAG: PepSY domain-containing protein [Kofleriaceae bacterium]